jgi:hypothetical protein
MNTLYCSFCGKSQNEVTKLIAGPNVFICDGCVQLCTSIVTGKEPLYPSKPMPNQPGSAAYHEAVVLLRKLLTDAERLSFHPSIRRNDDWTRKFIQANDLLRELATAMSQLIENANNKAAEIVEFEAPVKADGGSS